MADRLWGIPEGRCYWDSSQPSEVNIEIRSGTDSLEMFSTACHERTHPLFKKALEQMGDPNFWTHAARLSTMQQRVTDVTELAEATVQEVLNTGGELARRSVSSKITRPATSFVQELYGADPENRVIYYHNLGEYNPPPSQTNCGIPKPPEISVCEEPDPWGFVKRELPSLVVERVALDHCERLVSVVSEGQVNYEANRERLNPKYKVAEAWAEALVNGAVKQLENKTETSNLAPTDSSALTSAPAPERSTASQ